MNVLFYLEPTLQGDFPTFARNWTTAYQLFAKTLRESKPEIRIQMLGPDLPGVDWAAYWIGYQTVSLSDVAAAYGHVGDLVRDYYFYDNANPGHVKFRGLLKAKLAGFVPDVVMTYNTPVPFLRDLFPDALVLHYEVGAFSRAPFPLTFYLDPHGHSYPSYVTLEKEFLLSRTPSADETALLASIRKTYLEDVLAPRNPFTRDSVLKGRAFTKTLLVPLQHFSFADFAQDTGFVSQFDLLCTILLEVGPDVGVVVTQRPDFKVLNAERVEYLRRTFPNFIYESEFDNWYASSQYLIPLVDAIFTVSLSLGLQALLWNKALLSVGDFGIAALAHCNRLDGLRATLAVESEPREGALARLFTHYFVPERWLRDSDWLWERIRAGRDLARRGGWGADLFGPIAPIGELTAFYEGACRGQNIPSHIPNEHYFDLVKNDPAYEKVAEYIVELRNQKAALIAEVDDLRRRLTPAPPLEGRPS